MALVPAIVVGDKCERGVGDLGLAGELCFLQIGHPDDVHSPFAINLRFRFGRESRTFHANVRAAAMRFDADRFARRLENVAKFITNRMCKRDVADDAFAEECRFRGAGVCSVKKLIRNQKIGWCVLQLQRTDSRHGQDIFDTEQFHRINVRPVGKFAWRQPVSTAMPRQKRNGHAVQFADDKRVGRFAKRSLDRYLSHILQLRHLIQPAAADDSNAYLFHT